MSLIIVMQKISLAGDDLAMYLLNRDTERNVKGGIYRNAVGLYRNEPLLGFNHVLR